LFGGLLDSIGSIANKNSRRSKDAPPRRPNTRVTYDDDDDEWI
jgi:hypothetical protein